METDRSQHLIELATEGLSREDATDLLALIGAALDTKAGDPARLDILARVRPGRGRIEFNSLALMVARSARQLRQQLSAAERAPVVRTLLHLRERAIAALDGPAQPPLEGAPEAAAGQEGGETAQDLSLEEGIRQVYRSAVGRDPVTEEIEIWKRNFGNGLPFHEFMLLMQRGPEASQRTQRLQVMGDACDGECIQTMYELVLGRGASAWEVTHWLGKLENNAVSRAQMLAELFQSAVAFRRQTESSEPHDGLSCLVLGTGKQLTLEMWKQQAEESKAADEPVSRYHHRFHIRSSQKVLVSALCSLYRGGDYIERFMDNITSQSCFDDHAELVIIDADSPENEYETIKRYLAGRKNIQYHRMTYRIGIYDAWNLAAELANGEYLTNTNLDDMRREDSFELQAGVLDNLPFVDVVYQDLYYTFDPNLSFEEIAAYGHKTELPVISPHNMLIFNSPHNAPMWRKRLHEELGPFDSRYKSAGDYEFWLRCLSAGKCFYKINDPHVVYYQNPKGLSTRPDTRGVVEAMEITKAYSRKLVPEEVREPSPDYVRRLGLENSHLEPGQGRYEMAQLALRRLARTAKAGPARAWA